MNKGCLIGLGIFLAVATAGLIYYFYQQRNASPENYETESPIVTDIVKKTVATGSIRPRQEVHIKPQVSGVVDELYVEPGEIVTKGQQIARIKLVPSEVNINNAQSNVELARLRLKDAERELARQKELNQRNLDVESARVSFENAQKEEDRQRGLFEDGIISEQDYNRFKLDLDLAKAEYDNAQIVASNSLRSFETTLDIRQQELDAAISNLQLLREGASRKSKQVANVVVFHPEMVWYWISPLRREPPSLSGIILTKELASPS